jgi:hypothetical protein
LVEQRLPLGQRDVGTVTLVAVDVGDHAHTAVGERCHPFVVRGDDDHPAR